MPKAKRIQLVLMRAGETAWDAEGRLVGAADLPMSDEARADVAESISAMSSIAAPTVKSVGVVLTGPGEAANDSAQMLADSLGCKTREVEKLAEYGLGLWEGVRGEDLEGRCPSTYRQWRESPASVTPPQGESLDEAEDRLLRAMSKSFEKIKAEQPVVGLVLRPMAWAVIKAWLTNQPISEIWTGRLESERGPETFEVERDSLRAAIDRLRASA